MKFIGYIFILMSFFMLSCSTPPAYPLDGLWVLHQVGDTRVVSKDLAGETYLLIRENKAYEDGEETGRFFRENGGLYFTDGKTAAYPAEENKLEVDGQIRHLLAVKKPGGERTFIRATIAP